jgi:hypothetical protein
MSLDNVQKINIYKSPPSEFLDAYLIELTTDEGRILS